MLTRAGDYFALRTPAHAGLADLTLPKPTIPGRSPQREAEELILSRYGPPGVIVTSDLDILHFRGQTGRYLEPAPGAASLNLLKMARRGLFVVLRAALAEAHHSGNPVRKTGVSYRHNGDKGLADIQILPLSAAAGEASLLVLFEEVARPTTATAPLGAEPDDGGSGTSSSAEAHDTIAALERELTNTREYMQAAIAEQDGTNEELRSLNEEIQSANEELQSTNEELETAKEELQSIEIPNLEALAQRVIDNLGVETLELQDNAGHWYSVRLRPYQTLDHRIDGAVITFLDIDELKAAEQLRLDLADERRLAVLVRDAMDAIVAQGFDGRILSWNPAAERAYGYTQAQALSMNIRQLIPDEDMVAWERTSNLVRQGQLVEPYRTRRRARDGRELAVWLVPAALLGDDGKPYGLGTTERYVGCSAP